jgi:hypothetical protein
MKTKIKGKIMDDLGKSLAGLLGVDRSSIVTGSIALFAGFIGSMRRITQDNQTISWKRIWYYMTSPVFFFSLGTALIAGMALGGITSFLGGDQTQVHISIAVGSWFGDKVFALFETIAFQKLEIERRHEDNSEEPK